MIKVNLVGIEKKKPRKAGIKIALPATFVPALLVVIVLSNGAGGYWWYSTLSGQSADLDQQIKGLEARKAALEAVIKQDQVYEGLKKTLETRVKIIEGLQKNQVSPVLVLDQLAEAVENTRYVWLSSLDQKEAVVNMSGIGTSLSAIADFYTNLGATGYFKNIDLGPSQENAGNFTFSLKCEFAPPRTPAARVESTTPTVGN